MEMSLALLKDLALSRVDAWNINLLASLCISVEHAGSIT